MLAGLSSAAGTGDFIVLVGSKQFAPGGDWPGYIGQQLTRAIDKSAGGVQRKAQEHLNSVAKYVEHFHGTRTWNGRLVNDSNRLQRRSGKTIEKFKRSYKVKPGRKGFDGMQAQMDVGMFGIHLTGGVITAKRSRYLTIPLPSACDRRGVPLKKSARDWPNTFVIRSKRGNLLICTKNANGGLLPLYLLKSSVRIPPRLHRLPEVWDSYTNRFERAVADEIERTIDAIKW